MKQHLDMGSLIVIIVTFILFLVAPFAKGFTHDLLLEAGVFLVSYSMQIEKPSHFFWKRQRPMAPLLVSKISLYGWNF